MRLDTPFLMLAGIGLFVAAVSLAQSQPAKIVSPEVHSDRRVTFRLRAPKATQVKVWGEWILRNNALEEMEQGEDGIWSVTVGPVPPSIYPYIFLVDEVVVLDPNNPHVQTGREGAAGSLLEVPAETPQVYDVQNVPHGVVHHHTYSSTTGLSPRRVVVYTPPAYDLERRKRYPVLYLLHGSGDIESSWTTVGRANVIGDNLIAARRAQPMIIVMPSGHVTPPGAPDPKDLRNSFNEDLVRDLIPLIDSRYRTIRDRKGRAIAGISMGAFQALWFGLDHPEMVNGLGIFGGGIFGPEGAADIDRFAARQNRAETKLQVFRIRVGDRDMNRSLSSKLDEKLTEHKIAHNYKLVPGAGHTWPFWRKCFAEILPMLFHPAK